MPVRYTVAAWPVLTCARSCSAICPRISTSPPLATRNRASPPGLAICPTSAWRVSTVPSTGAVMRRAREARLRFGELRGDHLDVGGIGDRGGATLFDVFRGQRAGGFHPLGTAVLGRRKRRLGAGLLERGRRDG